MILNIFCVFPCRQIRIVTYNTENSAANKIYFSTVRKSLHVRPSLYLFQNTVFFSMALPTHSGPWPLFQFRNNVFTDDRTPWTSDQPVTSPLPKHRTTQTQNKRIHITNIHALTRIQTHDPNVRASEHSSCFRLRGYCDRLRTQYYPIRALG
jgi:hypothetical protein